MSVTIHVAPLPHFGGLPLPAFEAADADGMDLRAMIGLGLLCGIGFTMSLFIGSLAFTTSPQHYNESVIGVLLASVVAALLGLAWLRLVLPKHARG